jgi:predicted nucleic acid-binding protein
MNVFIDTNVFLSFYHLTNDDLEELRKLKVLLEKGNIVLHLPGQTVDEYWRNRETKIAAALKSLKDQKLNLQFPALCKDYEEYGTLRQVQKDFENRHSSLIGQISDDIESNSLKADLVI